MLMRAVARGVALAGFTVLGPSIVGCGGAAGGGEDSVFLIGPGLDASLAGDGAGVQRDASEGDATTVGIVSHGDAGLQCVPQTCVSAGFTCGPASDGCGGLLQCGACSAGQSCGYGGYDVCGSTYTGTDGAAGPDGAPPSCSPTTCATLGYDCGPAGDGCGNQLDCGSCVAPQFCGGGGPGVCGGNTGLTADGSVACTPTTGAALGYDCGPAGDGCGGLLQCGTCVGSNICGGAGQPGVCGNSTCTNLCTQVVQCDGGASTTVTGAVLAGLSAWTGLPADPVPNVLVYVPNGAVQPFAPGAACRQCGSDVSGSPLVSAYTNFDGTFTLTNVPAGANIPLVVQLGRWRRQFSFNVAPCTTTAVGGLHLPRNRSEGDIPLTAISTGNVDPLECVLLKMGLDQTEFTPDSGPGRIQIYGGGPLGGAAPQFDGPGSTAGPGTRQEAALMDVNGTFMNYDQILLPCWGNPTVTKTAAELANLVAYADSGGHFFSTHYSDRWLIGNGEFNSVAQWAPDFDNPGAVTWTLQVSTLAPPSPPAAHGGAFAQWLNLVGALANAGPALPANPAVLITNPRHDANAVANGSVDWIDGVDQRPNSRTFDGGNSPLVEHFTFNTPVASAATCGHAIFSDFHVAGIANGLNTNGQAFPAECTTTFTPQEKILEYMIFDLASCAGPPPTPSCTPRTCAQQTIACGPAGDGCGNLLDCGTCTPPLTCGGGGVPGQCGAIDGGVCAPETCAQQSIGCGPAGDGCGNLLDCGTCTPPLTCGGGGVPGQCGAIDGGSCTPRTCAQLGVICGPAGDGCGNLLDCGSCVAQ